jgi:hypothetical protein
VSSGGPRLKNHVDGREAHSGNDALYNISSCVGIIRKTPLTHVTANAIILMQSNHESLTRDERAAPGSERSFAIVMAVALALLASINWWHNGHLWPWLGGIAAFFVVSGYFFPAPLKPLNRLWFKFGLLLHAVVNPLVMGLIFYGAVLPIGLVMRAAGKDLLRLKIERDRDSYWIIRKPPGPAPETMKDQF